MEHLSCFAAGWLALGSRHQTGPGRKRRQMKLAEGADGQQGVRDETRDAEERAARQHAAKERERARDSSPRLNPLLQSPWLPLILGLR